MDLERRENESWYLSSQMVTQNMNKLQHILHHMLVLDVAIAFMYSMQWVTLPFIDVIHGKIVEKVNVYTISFYFAPLGSCCTPVGRLFWNRQTFRPK